MSFSPVVGIGTPPTPYPAGECAPPPFGSGGRGTLAGERGRVPIPTRGHALWYAMYFVVIRIFTAQGTVWGELPVRLRPLRPRGGGRRAAGVRRSRFAVSHGVHDGDTARSPARLLPVSRLRDEGATRDTSTVQKREF
jgi:hypothetical protein